ncbi:MAG: lytic transglycosylase domain-containing protein [Chitinophagaceae bacterium]
MLHSKFSKAVFIGHLLLFIAFPFTSYQHPQSTTDPDDDAKACAVPAPAVAIKLNKNAVKFVNSYLQKNTDDLVKIKERSAVPFKTMDQIFTKYNLPLELKYLAVIESELNPSAVSRVGAVGPWQLMPTTAKILGLKVSARNDERRQYYKSTKAAAIYLRDLYTEFDDWLLVMAAYNCGPGPVYTAIKKSGSRNFWKLQAYLPEESRDHVKKFIATHYYFEGNGSVTTLTHAETIKYAKLMIAARDKALQMQQPSQDTLSKITMASFAASVAYGY